MELTRLGINLSRGREGFTLVELVVVIAILGVLAAIAIPTVSNYLTTSKVQAYNSDRERIQLAVDSFFSDPANDRFLGRRQYPLLGAGKVSGAFYQGDAGNNPDVVTISGNPLGGTIGGSPNWVDDGNGVRDPSEEVLRDEDTPQSTQAWHVATVDRQGTTYFVDSRDYFINFDILVSKKLLDKIPASASPDNKPPGSTLAYNGSYSWFVNSNGNVDSLYRFFPKSDRTGFQQAFP